MDMPIMESDAPEGFEEVTESDPLAEKWASRLDKALKHYDHFFKRCRHNRKIVDGFNWKEDPDGDSFISRRANLIQGTSQPCCQPFMPATRR